MTEKEWLLCFEKEAFQFDFVLFTKKPVIIRCDFEGERQNMSRTTFLIHSPPEDTEGLIYSLGLRSLQNY